MFVQQEVIRGRLSRENSGGGRCGDDTGACGDIMKVDVSAENLDDSDLDKDFMGSDSDSEIKVCTLCGEDGGDDALSCSEVGCPVSFHRGCAPGYNGSGKYFCPYCKYKNATLMKAKLKRKAIEMNNLLSDFLCHMPSVRDNVKMDDRGGEEWELNVSRHLSENGVSNVLKQRRVEEKNSLEVAGTENVMEPTSVRLGHWTSKGEKKVQAQNIHEHVHECGEEVHAEENNIMDGSDERIDVVKSIQRSEEEQNLSGGIISSDYDNKALSVDKRHLPSKGKQKLKTVNVAEEENSLSEGGTISSDYDSDIDNKPLSVRKKHLPSRGELKLPAKNGGTSKKLSSSKDKNTSFRNASMPAQIKSIKQPPATQLSTHLSYNI